MWVCLSVCQSVCEFCTYLDADASKKTKNQVTKWHRKGGKLQTGSSWTSSDFDRILVDLSGLEKILAEYGLIRQNSNGFCGVQTVSMCILSCPDKNLVDLMWSFWPRQNSGGVCLDRWIYKYCNWALYLWTKISKNG